MFKQHHDFAVRLVDELKRTDLGFKANSQDPAKLMVPHPSGDWASLDLTPFAAQAQPADAMEFFTNVLTVDDLLNSYANARQAKPFERDIPGATHYVSDYAESFLQQIMDRAREYLSDNGARQIAELVSHLDIYTSVKVVESLLNCEADLRLLKIAEEKGWSLHFDHLAIRCGSAARGDAERVVENLQQHHGYITSHVEGESYYQFDDGWDAYVLFKILENGQQLRLFIDQSMAGETSQIIQHWNHVYGYTAHHLALRATRSASGLRIAVSLEEQIEAMDAEGIDVLTPTGQYTGGLLEQAFTRPQRNIGVPNGIKDRLRLFDPSLVASIENAKLLELISRSEMPAFLKPEYFSLYGLEFDPSNVLHSAPFYPYFLPAQAAHVIRTSVQVA